MKKHLVAVLLLCSYTSFSQNNPYEKAWNALNENKRAEAGKFLQQAMSEPATAQDAFITNLYLKTYNGKEDEVTDFMTSFYSATSTSIL